MNDKVAALCTNFFSYIFFKLSSELLVLAETFGNIIFVLRSILKKTFFLLKIITFI